MSMSQQQAKHTPEPKFDAIHGTNFPFRLLQGVTRVQLDAYCAANGYRITSERAIGLRYAEATIAKATGSAA